MIEIVLPITVLILYFGLLYIVLFLNCSAHERTLTSCSDVETPLVFSQVNTEDIPKITPSRSITSQMAGDKMDQILEEHLDDNNNSAFPVTTPLEDRTSYESIFKDYACKTPYRYSSLFHNSIDIYNI